ncbi:hypothetical protein PFISCL1PPCAC_27951, partial [Pristionchus fissidentatus]
PPKHKSSRDDQRKAKLAEMLGVSESEPIVRKTSGFMDEHDSEALEELSRRGMQIEIPMLDTSQLDTASTTPRSTARGVRPNPLIGTRGGRGGTVQRSDKRKGVHGMSKDRDRLVKATMETSTRGGRERSESIERKSPRKVTDSSIKTKPKMTSAEERLYNFRSEAETTETTTSSSSGYKQRPIGLSRSPLRSTSDKSYRQSGRDAFPIALTGTGLVSARSPEPTHPRPSRLAYSSRGASTFKSSSKSVEPRRLSQPKIQEQKKAEPKIDVKGKQEIRLRKPVRQLSSISEKSAEVNSEYALAGTGETAMSAPSTTRRFDPGRTPKRLLLSPPPSKRRLSPPFEHVITSPMGSTIIEKKLILETIISNEGTDVDMPLTSRHESVADLKGILIVEKKTEYSSDSMDPVPRPTPSMRYPPRSLTGRSDSFLPPISADRSFRSASRPSLRASNTSLPSLTQRRLRDGRHSNDSSSATSSDFPTPPVASSLLELNRRQIPAIRKKIRLRQSGDDFHSQRDLRSIGRNQRDGTSRSADDLCDDCSDTLLKRTTRRPRSLFRPSRLDRLPVLPRGVRHSSLQSLRSATTISSTDLLSPYLGRDPNLPPKENLWWGAH